MITKASVISLLRKELPEFPLNEDWVSGILGYPLINDLARFICEFAETKCFKELKRAVSVLDMLWEDGDSYIKDLVHECLETIVFCDSFPVVEEYLSAELRVISSKMKPGR